MLLSFNRDIVKVPRHGLVTVIQMLGVFVAEMRIDGFAHEAD